jgi:minor extracellular serine protease Vpr
MRRLAATLASLTLILFAFAAGARAAEEVTPLSPAPSAETGQMTDETSHTWFVELQSPAIADGGTAAATAQDKQSFRASARKAGVAFTERYAYSSVWNGLSIQVNPGDLPKLSRLSEVKALYPVTSVALPEPQPEPSPELSTAIAMTQVDIAQSSLGLTGAGVRVAVMDTGIDYDHPDLGGCFGPGCRVEMGYDLVGDAYNNDSTSPSYSPVPHPDPFPDDCAGHGTHVSGIIGANGAVRGVAPGVTFHAYRVFGCAGSTSSDIMLAAMERILADGADVLNMSIGSSFQWPEYPTAKGSRALVNQGIVVVASIGNDGARGLYAASAPGVGDKVIGVASFDNTFIKSPTFTASPDSHAFGYSQATAAAAAPLSGTAPLARTGTTTSTADGCAALPAGSLAGKVALIRRGTCGFQVKAANAQAAGAAGVVIYNNAAGVPNITVAGPIAITIPVVSISNTDGAILDGRIAAGPTSLTWTTQVIATPNATGNTISSFSSYGLTPDLDMKPDLGAPGGFIRSTYPLEQGGYTNLSGTSMSSPHVAGAVALLLQAHPTTPAQAVRTILENTAEPRAWWGNPALGFLDNVHRQGAGMLQIANAVLATTRIEPAKLPLGESQAGPAVRTVTLSNSAATPVTYDLSHAPALATGPNTFTPSFLTGFATVTFDAPSVTVPAGGTATVTATITADPTLPDRSLYGGYLVFTPQAPGNAGVTLRVPYAGFKGDYQAIQVLTPTAAGFPWLAKISGGSFVNQPAGGTYTLQGGDLPFFLVHLDHPSRRLRIDVFDAATGKAWHTSENDQYLPRNSTSTGFFAFSWDGQTTAGGKTYTAPNGSYVVVLTVEKALGDPATNPADTETWTSPVITIARP